MHSAQPSTYYKDLLKTEGVHSFITTKQTGELELMRSESCDWPIHFMEQVHGNHFEIVEKEAGISGSVGQADAMITMQKQILLRVKVADCLPVLAYFPDHAVAAIHSGRASTEGNIVGRVLQYLKAQKPSSQSPILWLGPCICFDCYQIDRETDLHYDLRGKVVDQILKVYPAATILHLDSCTLENPQWHSYREDKTKERMYAYIGLR